MNHKIIGAIALGAALFAVGTTAQASSHSTIPAKLRALGTSQTQVSVIP